MKSRRDLNLALCVLLIKHTSALEFLHQSWFGAFFFPSTFYLFSALGGFWGTENFRASFVAAYSCSLQHAHLLMCLHSSHNKEKAACSENNPWSPRCSSRQPGPVVTPAEMQVLGSENGMQAESSENYLTCQHIQEEKAAEGWWRGF